jgi:hypothetical protein
MRLIITENQHNKLRIVKKSDLDDSGTWSADVLTHKSEGKNIYTYSDGVFTKREKKPLERGVTRHGGSRTEIFYLTDEQAEQANDLINQSRELERQAKELRQQAKDVIQQEFHLPQKR